jgi:hypothetical protein
MAVGLIGWLYKFYSNKKENKNSPNKTQNKNENTSKVKLKFINQPKTKNAKHLKTRQPIT